MRKLFALFIAIDNYAIPSHNLNGCENDMMAVQQFLKRYAAAQQLEYFPLIIKNKKATRSGIIEGFDHFQKAQSGDCCFFYYSGHGSQAVAPSEFWTNPNGMNESIVCHDSRLKGGRDLMDKELSYLIWQATKDKEIHFLAMMDCCHSGSGTRTIEGSQSRMVMPNFTPQKLTDYLGYETYEKKDGKIHPPSSNHVLLAACRDNETAKEQYFNGVSRGVFTYALMEVLENGGIHQSYQELMQRTRIKTEQLTVQQHPQLEGQHGGQSFLNIATDKDMPYIVYFNSKKKAWLVDVGGLQGLVTNTGLKLENGHELEISKVLTNESIISGMENMDQTIQYSAWMMKDGLPRISLLMDADLPKDLTEYIKRDLERYAEMVQINWVEKEENTQYVIRLLDNHLILTKVGTDIPIFQRVHPQNIDDFSYRINSIAYWEKVLSVNNPKSKITNEEIEIKVRVFDHPLASDETDDKEEFINPVRPIVLRIEEVTDEEEYTEERGQIWQIEVTNKSKIRDYWINGVYLDASFGVNSPADFNTNIRLEKGQTQILFSQDDRGDLMPKNEAWLDDAYLTWGVNEITDYVKIFVSTKEMNRTYRTQPPLPLDVKGAESITPKAVRRPKKYRGDDWKVFDLSFKIQRPFTEVSLKNGQTESLHSLKIKAPIGFAGKASLTNLKEITRDLNYSLPPFFWKTANQEIILLTRGIQQSDGLEVLEIFQTQNKAMVTAENPLILSFDKMNKTTEMMIPWGVDASTGLFYPLGGMDEAGNTMLTTLPDETPTKRTRSLGGSIKIFFQKLTKVFYKHPLLQQVTVRSSETMIYLEKDLPAIKTTIETGKPKKIALFIHGIIGDTKEMTKVVKRVQLPNGQDLNDYYDVVLTFDYENLSTSIMQTAEDLKAHLTKAGLGENHGHNLHIYAHSMGGLVSRWLIEQLKGDQMVQHLFQFGTPNGGSEWSNVQEMATLLLTNAVNGAAYLQPYLLPLSLAGQYLKKIQLTLQQMNPASDFIKSLNDGTKPPIPYSIINGNTQLIEVPMSEGKQHLLKRIITRFKNRGHYDALDVLLFKNPNDICVTVSSQTKLNEGTVYIKKVIGCNHISYFVNPVSLSALEEVLAERFETVFQ